MQTGVCKLHSDSNTNEPNSNVRVYRYISGIPNNTYTQSQQSITTETKGA